MRKSAMHGACESKEISGSVFLLLLLLAVIIQLSHGANIEVDRRKRQSCSSGQFQCNSEQCVDQLAICDGVKDCQNGADETAKTCQNIACPKFAFRCDYGACINRTGLCNGVHQCADGSDEKPETCGSKPTSKPTPELTPSRSGGCILPLQPKNGQYTLGGCVPPSQSESGQTVHAAYLIYSCNPGFVLSGTPVLLCQDKWSAEFPICVRAMCSALVNPSREIECKRDEIKVNCNLPMAPGAKATVKCGIVYTNVKELDDFDTTCQPDGSWSREVHSCLPKCGEPNPDGVLYVAGGSKAKYGEFPWHAGIYRLIDDNFVQICGGSIVTERTIVTAAHCFWNSSAERPIDYKEFRIAVGKFHRNWNDRDERFAQFPDILAVILHDRFKGGTLNYADDIAVINLKQTILMSIAVRPICVDFNSDFDRYFKPGVLGIVMGWGITENQIQSETLHKATLPYVDFEVCKKEVPTSFLPFLTDNKFCAGYHNGTSVCPGDTGGYATQFTDGKWYLMGVVSVGVPAQNNDACNAFQYTAFTKVSEYYDFIQKHKKD